MVVPPVDHDCVLKNIVTDLANRLAKLEPSTVSQDFIIRVFAEIFAKYRFDIGKPDPPATESVPIFLFDEKGLTAKNSRPLFDSVEKVEIFECV